MSRNNLSYESFSEILAAERIIYFRALIYKKEGNWTAYSLRAGNLPFNTKMSSSIVEYGDVAFVSGQVSGKEISEWLRNKKIHFEEQDYVISMLQENIYARQFPSLTNVFWLKIPFPFTTYQISHNDTDLATDYEPLIAENVPSFPSLLAAVQFYFYGEEYKSDHQIPQNFDFFIAEQRCWFERIYLRSSSIQIEIDGTNVKDTRLEVRAGSLYFEKHLKKRGKINIQFPNGLPESLWLILSHNNKWLDFRELNLNSNYWVNRKDVVKEAIDKPTEVKGIIVRGEGETTEFKEKVPNEKESIKKLVKTIAAFANGNGGVLIVGVEDRIGRIVGIQGNVDKEYNRLVQMVRNNLATQPDLNFEKHIVEGFCLFTVTVKSGDTPPYGIEPANLRYYVRRGATTFPASQNEVRTLAQKSLLSNSYDMFE